jgi:hypothetical protein
MAVSQYEHAPDFGRLIGMSCDCFCFLFPLDQHLILLSISPEGSSSKKHRWIFVTAFNKHCAAYALVFDRICVDKFLSRCCGQGGSNSSHGLPWYMPFDCKVIDSCEILTLWIGCSGIMLQLKLVKKATKQQLEEMALNVNKNLYMVPN